MPVSPLFHSPQRLLVSVVVSTSLLVIRALSFGLCYDGPVFHLEKLSVSLDLPHQISEIAGMTFGR